MIGFIGGTGPEGRGLGLRFAMAGEEVLIGSRDAGRAEEAAAKVARRVGEGKVSGAVNAEAARRADTVFVTMPYEGQQTALEALREPLAGKVVVSVVAPLSFEGGTPHAVVVKAGSAAQEAKELLPESRVVAAFQTVSAHELLDPTVSVDSDVVVCGDDAEAKTRVMALAEKVRGVRAVDGGGLANARYVEDLTALLLNINRIYKARSAIKIVGI